MPKSIRVKSLLRSRLIQKLQKGGHLKVATLRLQIRFQFCVGLKLFDFATNLRPPISEEGSSTDWGWCLRCIPSSVFESCGPPNATWVGGGTPNQDSRLGMTVRIKAFGRVIGCESVAEHDTSAANTLDKGRPELIFTYPRLKTAIQSILLCLLVGGVSCLEPFTLCFRNGTG